MNSGKLIEAAKRGDNETVIQLLKSGVSVNSVVTQSGIPVSALIVAVTHEQFDTVRLLLKQRNILIDLVPYYCNALQEACKSGDDEMADLLLCHNADVCLMTEFKSTPLSLAVWNGNMSTVDILLKHGAIATVFDENENDQSAFSIVGESRREHFNNLYSDYLRHLQELLILYVNVRDLCLLIIGYSRGDMF